MTGSTGRRLHTSERSRRGIHAEARLRHYAAEAEGTSSPCVQARLHSQFTTPLETTQNLTLQGSPRNHRGAWQCTDHKVFTRRLRANNIEPDRPQAPRNKTSRDRITHRLGDDESNACRSCRLLGSDVNQCVGRRHPTALSHRGAKVIRTNNTVDPLQHEATSESKDYADNSVRPLRRRAARIERPARVRMRRRKPCTFARRRLFGWNVLLLMAVPFKTQLCM
jgi:hypothetical protein